MDNNNQDESGEGIKTSKRVQHEVFLGYSSNRVSEVTLLKSSLEQKGFVCWLDVDEIDDKSSFSSQDQIDQAIRNSKAMVACFDKDYMNSNKDIAEVSLATYLGKRVVPIDWEPNNWSDSKMAALMDPAEDHIPFYTSNATPDPNSNNLNIWPPESFDELVRRLRATPPPKEPEPVQEPKPPVKSKPPPAPAPVQVQPEPDPPPPPKPTIRPAEYHIITSCSAENLHDIKNLAVHFKYMGYQSKIMPLSEKRNFKVPPFDCNVLVCALTPSYQKSKEAAQIIQTAVGKGVDIVPLRMERERPYPPKLMADTLDKIEPVDVSQHEPNAEWDHTKQLDDVKVRLRALIPVIDANQQVKGKKLPDYAWLMPKPKNEGEEDEEEPGDSRSSRSRSRRRQQRSASSRMDSARSSGSRHRPKSSKKPLVAPLVFSSDEEEKKKNEKNEKKKSKGDGWSSDEDSWGDSKVPNSKTRAAKYVPAIGSNQSGGYTKPKADEPQPTKPRTPITPDTNHVPARSRAGPSSRSRRRSLIYSSDNQNMLTSQYRRSRSKNY